MDAQVSPPEKNICPADPKLEALLTHVSKQLRKEFKDALAKLDDSSRNRLRPGTKELQAACGDLNGEWDRLIQRHISVHKELNTLLDNFRRKKGEQIVIKISRDFDMAYAGSKAFVLNVASAAVLEHKKEKGLKLPVKISMA